MISPAGVPIHNRPAIPSAKAVTVSLDAISLGKLTLST